MTCTPGNTCWCAALPPGPMPAEPGACLCPECLRAKLLAEGKMDKAEDIIGRYRDTLRDLAK